LGNQIKYVSKLPELLKVKEDKDGVIYRQEDVAEIIGVTRQSISRWFQDRPFDRIHLTMVEPLSQWLGVEWYMLIERLQNGKH
jgi:transcriptional regulator with XRE-family HTH domain